MNADTLTDRRRPGAPVAPSSTAFRAFDHIAGADRDFTVADACSSARGVWYCIPHRAELYTQESKDDHLGTSNSPHSRCLLAWICREHAGRPESVVVSTRGGKARP